MSIGLLVEFCLTETSVVRQTGEVQIRFTQAARRHRIGRAHVKFVLVNTEAVETVTNRGEVGWLYVGPDDRGVMLEVIAVETDTGDLLVTHVMPASYRRRFGDD